ncbi:ArsR/SmtB family transcription factor [Anaerotalea alkaliphila]|uniref:Winged helix-turn-helix transcriptional regulator n=1 Tax=Anaerotalea alkaliphila TaxID=2662126 RepID=A0A7X5HXN3_9FIRM|nr:metalloregulator ArsR/SmtB family transcription factor [Anaerotalea alkaliphila]NDL68555.1 winged helix-turn-helix transcriptional regulator [Anaerotalea alkaliphila]
MDQLTNIFKTLSDETRLRLLLLLQQEELCVCQLSGILDVPQPRVSKNLSKLRDMQLVADERKEKFVFYTLKRDNKLLMEILEKILEDPELYPQLAVDRMRLGEKEKYLDRCGIRCG